jgi:hypothetical protein
MRFGQKKESLLGLVITAVLCLGFLWWWFRPKPKTWQEESAAQLVARALAEPRPESRAEQQVLDLDLMEIALIQLDQLKDEEAAHTTAACISDPVVRLIAARQLAREWTNEDKDLSAALGFTALVPDPGQAEALRADILGMLAARGFPDAALPEAKTPLQKATLAVRMEGADDKARELLAEATAALPTLPPEEAAAVRREIARGLVRLSVIDGPDAAIAAIKELPPEQRGEQWMELISWCQGREDKAVTVPLVARQVEDPALRRRLEIQSLLLDVKLRPAGELIAECRAAVEQATAPEDKAAALLTLADAQYNDRSDPAQEIASVETLKSALAAARSVAAPAVRCRLLLRLPLKFSYSLVFDFARSALDEAVAAARAEPSPGERVSLLLAASEECHLQSDTPRALELIEEASQTLDQSQASPPAGVVQALAIAFAHRFGDWPRSLGLVERISDDTARRAALQTMAAFVAEESSSIDPGEPPPRGEVLDNIRRTALTDQAAAANLTETQPEGFARARGWLAMAKATILPPQSLTDYQMSGAQPVDLELPGEGGAPDEGLPPGEDQMEDPVIKEP